MASSDDLKMIFETLNLMRNEITSMSSKNENCFTEIRNPQSAMFLTQKEFQQSQDIIKAQQSELREKQTELNVENADVTARKVPNSHDPASLSSLLT